MALNITIHDCAVESESSKQWTLSEKIAAAVLSSLLMLCIIGTWLDMSNRKQSEEKHQVDENINRELLKSFSVYRNTKAVFKSDSKKHAIDFINGLKVVYCLWILMIHYCFFPTLWKETQYKNFHYSHEFFKPEVIFMVLSGGFVSVEGFFYISGFLLTYFLWSTVEKTEGKIEIFQIIIVKYWRLTCVHLFVIIISFLLPIASSGPMWESTWEHENEKCLVNGWKNLLYIHNFDTSTTMCWLHSWYIGVTMQCVVLFIPLTVFIYKYPKCGIFVCLMIMFGSMVHDYNASIEQGFLFGTFNSLKTAQRTLDFVNAIYLNTTYHLPSNLIGMLSGWICLKYRNPKIPKVWLVVGCLFCALCFATLYIPYSSIESLRIAALFNATRGTVFSLGLSWIFFTCATGYGGVVDKVLSWKAWRPLNQISYCVYLVHPVIMVLRYASVPEKAYVDKISVVMEVIPYILMTYVFGFVVHVMVEEPFNRLLDLLLKKKIASKQKPLQHSTLGNKDNIVTETR